MNAGQMTCTFVEGELSKRCTSAAVMGRDMPEGTRVAELIVSNEAIVIRFPFPKLDQQQFAEAAKKPVEAF